MKRTAENIPHISECSINPVEQTLAAWFDTGQVFNARAIRARAGVLNVIIGTTIVLILTMPEVDVALYASVALLIDMIAAVVFGLTPLSPTGVLGTALTSRIEPEWTPHLPKRFAWLLGASLSATCLILHLCHLHEMWTVGAFGVFFVLTWLDSALGFCVGCWIYSKFFGCQTCHVG